MAEKEKQLNGRIIHKHDTEINWLKAIGFTPKQGELIVYDVDENYNYQRIKIGDGIHNVNELPFYAGSWNDLIDKPTVIAGGGTLTWDGNTDGLLCVSAELDGEMTPLFYKISDAVPTRQDFEKGIVAFSNEGNVVFGWQEKVYEEHMNAVFDMLFHPDGFFVYDWFYIVPTDNYVWEFDLAITFPESGIYVMNPEMHGGFIQSLTITDYTGFESEVLKESIIPDTIARKKDIPEQAQPDWNETDETSPSYIRNKPDESDALLLIMETGLVQPVSTDSGDILTDSNNNIIIL